MILIFKRKQNIFFKVHQILTNIYGIGATKCNTLLIRLGVNFKTSLFQLKKFRALKLNQKLLILNKFFFFEVLKLKEIQVHYIRVIIGCYKGIKLNYGLPLNGQKTRTNAKTSKRLNKNKGLSAIVKSKIIYERKKQQQQKKRK